ncbi:MAG: YeeE/YedE family protein [Nitrospirae bacterium]|nr:YeeE/YedE family protein [Nitrospirota bacterium]
MFTAILVAASGLYLLSDIDLFEIGRLRVVPTFFWPQIVGGAIFGLGFVISGYCPGTAVAGFASGRLDAMVTLIGVGAGSLIFAVIFPYIESFYMCSLVENASLPKLLGINHWLILAFLFIFAAGMFYMMERYERRHG